jgi:hypothetical protein
MQFRSQKMCCLSIFHSLYGTTFDAKNTDDEQKIKLIELMLHAEIVNANSEVAKKIEDIVDKRR